MSPFWSLWKVVERRWLCLLWAGWLCLLCLARICSLLLFAGRTRFVCCWLYRVLCLSLPPELSPFRSGLQLLLLICSWYVLLSTVRSIRSYQIDRLWFSWWSYLILSLQGLCLVSEKSNHHSDNPPTWLFLLKPFHQSAERYKFKLRSSRRGGKSLPCNSDNAQKKQECRVKPSS